MADEEEQEEEQDTKANFNTDDRSVSGAVPVAPGATSVEDILKAKTYEVLLRQVVLSGNHSRPGEGHMKRDVDSFTMGETELKRHVQGPTWFKAHCEANYQRTFGGGRYLLGVRDPQSGKMREVARCMVDGPALNTGADEPAQPQQSKPAAGFNIPFTTDGDGIPKTMEAFLVWFTQMQVKSADAKMNAMESQLREEQRNSRELLREMLKSKQQGGLNEAAQQIGMMKSIFDIVGGFGGRELSGPELALKVIESPAVQDLAQETIGLVRDLGDSWGSAQRLDMGEEIDVEAKEMVKSNRRGVKPEVYMRKLKALTNGKVPDDVLQLSVAEVNAMADERQKTLGQAIPAKERLNAMYEGLKLINMVKDAALAVNNFVIKGSRTSADAAQYLIANIREKSYLDWMKSNTYEKLMERLEPWKDVKSLRQVRSFYLQPQVAKVVREVLEYLKDPAKLERAKAGAGAKKTDSVPDFTEDDFGVDGGEDGEGGTLSDQEEGGKEE